jgi:hypothetical protein
LIGCCRGRSARRSSPLNTMCISWLLNRQVHLRLRRIQPTFAQAQVSDQQNAERRHDREPCSANCFGQS